MTKFLRESFARFEPYTPGEQKKGIRIKLNTNESPYPPSPLVFDAISSSAKNLMRYPPPDADNARAAAARRWKLDDDQVLVGNGSDEILRLIFHAYVNPGDRVIAPSPTYTLYDVLARMFEASLNTIPRDSEYRVRVPETGAADGRVIILASPNSPTGTVTPPAEIRGLLKSGKLVVVDEAYADFSDSTAIGLVREYENLIVLRTLSKSYSLAGLRVGFALAQVPIISELRMLKDSYNVGMIPDRAAAAALDDEPYAASLRAKIIASRQKLSGFLAGAGWKVYSSGANFLFAEPPTGKNGGAKAVYESLRSEGILVRWFGNDPRTANAIRITIGTNEELEALMEALGRI